MGRPSPVLWLALLLLLLLPTAAGRVLLDIAGGLLLAAFLIPLLLTGVGWLGWRALQSRVMTCSVCGVGTLSNTGSCPVCGSTMPKAKNSTSSGPQKNDSTPASSATIDVIAEDAEDAKHPY